MRNTSRSAARAKHYLVDFGISVYIPESVSPKLATGFLGRDRDLPELSNEEPYDPFRFDIFIIGNARRRFFHLSGVRLPLPYIACYISTVRFPGHFGGSNPLSAQLVIGTCGVAHILALMLQPWTIGLEHTRKVGRRTSNVTVKRRHYGTSGMHRHAG